MSACVRPSGSCLYFEEAADFVRSYFILSIITNLLWLLLVSTKSRSCSKAVRRLEAQAAWGSAMTSRRVELREFLATHRSISR